VKRVSAQILVLIVASVIVAACTRAGRATGPHGELRIRLGINPSQLNPLFVQTTSEQLVDGLVFDSLLAQDAKNRDIPDLATTVPTPKNGGISRNGLTITFLLRRGVTWHDGAPFTSRDVQFTWQAIMNPANNAVPNSPLDGLTVSTPDSYTATFHLRRAFSPASDWIAAAAILPAHLLARYGNLNHIAFNARPIGTGPFEFVRWERGERIVLAANRRYFRRPPRIRLLTLVIVPDDNSAAAQIRTHEVDLDPDVLPPIYHQLTGAPGVTLRKVDAPAFVAIAFNTVRSPLADVRVRRALVLAMDRASIVRADTYGVAQLASADISPYSWGYDPSLRPIPYDPVQARALLDASGWHLGSDGFRVRNGTRLTLQLAYIQGSSFAHVAAVQIQQMYRAIGLELELKAYDAGLLYAPAESGGILNGGRFDLTVFPTGSSSTDPDNSSLWKCGAAPPVGNNITRYCSPQMDELQRQALSTYDRSARKKLYSRIEALLLRDAPAAFIYYRPTLYASIADLKNFAPNGISPTWNAEDWVR
jgi:peptide/nickel transport system substrate-binding protein